MAVTDRTRIQGRGSRDPQHVGSILREMGVAAPLSEPEVSLPTEGMTLGDLRVLVAQAVAHGMTGRAVVEVYADQIIVKEG